MEPLIEECYLIYFYADNIHYRELDFALGRILELKGGLKLAMAYCLSTVN